MLIRNKATLTIIPIAAAIGVWGAASAQSSAEVSEWSGALTAKQELSVELYREISARNPGENICFSPAGVGFVLAMVFNGAAGETRSEIFEVMRCAGKDLSYAQPDSVVNETINRSNQYLRNQLISSSVQGIELSIANSMWGRMDIDFKPEFLKAGKKYYGAEISSVDFRDASTAGRINSWVEKNTGGRIKNIVDKVEADDVMFIINAIYFRGEWKLQFDLSLTRKEDFHLSGGAVNKVPMMRQTSEDFNYYETEEFQAVKLLYGEKHWRMYIFLPREKSDLERFSRSLTLENWNRWMRGFRKQEGTLVMPRFKMENSYKLNEILSGLGMETAFDQAKADFSELAERRTGANIYIDEALQKSFIEVNEKGSEAAAATSVRFKETAYLPEDKPFLMVVNRPFFFAIYDDNTNTFLFMGGVRKL